MPLDQNNDTQNMDQIFSGKNITKLAFFAMFAGLLVFHENKEDKKDAQIAENQPQARAVQKPADSSLVVRQLKY